MEQDAVSLGDNGAYDDDTTGSRTAEHLRYTQMGESPNPRYSPSVYKQRAAVAKRERPQ